MRTQKNLIWNQRDQFLLLWISYKQPPFINKSGKKIINKKMVKIGQYQTKLDKIEKVEKLKKWTKLKKLRRLKN